MTDDYDPNLDHAVALALACINSAGKPTDPKSVGDLMRTMYAAVRDASAARPAIEAPAGGRQVTQTEMENSLTVDHIISFEDGKKYAVLTRHLRKFGLTPQAYRAKWGLPADYPMVSVGYSNKRSTMARKAGLGGHKRVPRKTGDE